MKKVILVHLNNKAHYEKVLGYIDTGEKEGAKLLADGRNMKLQGYENGIL